MTRSPNDFPPSFTATRLFEKTSARGNVYMVGRLGGVRVTLMKSHETAEDGGAIWELKFAAAAPRPSKDDAADTKRDVAKPAALHTEGRAETEIQSGRASHQTLERI